MGLPYQHEIDAIAAAGCDFPQRLVRVSRVFRLLQFGASPAAIRVELGWWPDLDPTSSDSRRWSRDLATAIDLQHNGGISIPPKARGRPRRTPPSPHGETRMILPTQLPKPSKKTRRLHQAEMRDRCWHTPKGGSQCTKTAWAGTVTCRAHFATGMVRFLVARGLDVQDAEVQSALDSIEAKWSGQRNESGRVTPSWWPAVAGTP